MRLSMARMMTRSCEILRSGSVVAGKAAAFAVHLTDVPCTPMLPITAEAAMRNGVEAPAGRSVIYAEGSNDIRSGDVVKLDDKELSIVAANRLPLRTGDILELVVSVARTERH